MGLPDAGTIFTDEEPLGPTAITGEIETDVFRLIYDRTAEPHRSSAKRPPTFIIGRRGSGKTSLLLSAKLDPQHLTVHLRSDGIYSRMSGVVRALEARIVLTEEGVADIWNMLLWAPIAMRLAESLIDENSNGELIALWEELTPARNIARERIEQGARQDDAVLDYVARRLLDFLDSKPNILAADTLADQFQLYSRPWAECIDAARQVTREESTQVFVLIDSIENIGPRLEQLGLTLRGLFHLVGRLGIEDRGQGYHLQCCFPSELWPSLHQISANPLKDFARSTLLQWEARDLIRLANTRLEEYVENHPSGSAVGTRDSLAELLPRTVRNRQGVEEPALSYMLRHTQLLPRQFLQILNKALSRAIADTGLPNVRPHDIVSAVSQVEAILCPEIFSAYSHIYPQAHDLCHTLVPYLPFKFTDDLLHKMCNQAGIRRRFGLDYPEVREMLARLGILGRFTGEEGFYDRAEFEYALEGSLNLAPEDTFCLHPLFVRECQSKDIRIPSRTMRPVYPSGTPRPRQVT